MEDVFFELVQVALGNRECLSRVPNEQEWKELFALCQKQAISGIVFQGLNILSSYGPKPPLTVLYEWIGCVQTIETRNRIVNKRCLEISQEFTNDGFKTCILKGQGNAVLYPKPLLRTPGDIDLYIINKTNKDVIRYVKKRNSKGRVLYHHIDMGNYKDVEVEVHYRPTFMFNLVHNRRLQKYYVAQLSQIEVELPEKAGCISVPNWQFNIIFQLSHVYNHLLHEGIGLRQILDYYYLLKSGNSNQVHDSRFKVNGSSENWEQMLNYLGLKKIAGAMMWLLNEVLGLSEEYQIAPKDERRGRVLLEEIMKGGNFGHYDAENQKANSAIKKNLQRIRRDFRMMRYFPSECIWEPVFRLYHWIWRLAY